MTEQGAERHDNDDQHHEAGECAKPGRTPASNGGDSQHDGQSFDRLDEGGKESGRQRRPKEWQVPCHTSFQSEPTKGARGPALWTPPSYMRPRSRPPLPSRPSRPPWFEPIA